MSNIVNTYFKFNFVQYIFILFLICGTIIKKNSTQLNVVKKHDTIYRTMYNHYEISKFVKEMIKKCNINHYHISHKYDLSKLHISIEKYDYIYFFRSKNLLVYFFKKVNEHNHKVFFEGVDEMSDLQYLSFPNKWFDEYTLKSVRKNLSETGFLFQITSNHIHRIKNEAHSIFHSFSYLNKKIYSENKLNIDDFLQSSKFHTKIEIEGYSMGGVLSQVFIYILLSNKYIQKYKLKIVLYIIESWWGGNKDFYEYLSSYVTIYNVMCVGSILYYYNLFFQNYFKVKKYVSFPVKPLFHKYIQSPFPIGVTEYFGDHHYISRFLKYIK